MTYSVISSSDIAFRWSSPNAIFYQHGATCVIDDRNLRNKLFGLLNSKVASYILNILCPTLSYTVNDVAKIPVLPINRNCDYVDSLISISRHDWDLSETSWDFVRYSLLHDAYHQTMIKDSYVKLRTHWLKMTTEIRRLEEENNRFFIEAYGLQNELTPHVSLREITLTCNPYYRYRGKESEEELESLLLADTMKEFISYSVGCMFGRYSLEKEGLILANAWETLQEYLRQVPEPTFMPDEDNVIPVLEGEWFEDDIAERFKDFLKVTFGEENFEENLAFLEEAIGRDLRGFFVRDFYNEHVKMYKKRPIYWLFSSPKGSFNALIYMHRYTPDTVSVSLN